MRFTPKQRALFGEARRFRERVVLEMPGEFFVVDLGDRYSFGPPGYRVMLPRDNDLPDDFSEAMKLDQGAGVIHDMWLGEKEISHHDVGSFLLFAEHPEEPTKQVIEAMIGVLKDHGWGPKKNGFWQAVLATLIAEKAA